MKRVYGLLLLVACKPDFAKRESLVDGVQILAVQAEPAEARAGEPVSFTALVVSPEGDVTTPVGWAFCNTPKLLTENGAVSPSCNTGGVPVPATTPLPAGGCAVFGPEITSAELRPRDPDITGGFYQPIRADTAGTSAFGFARLRCNRANVGAATIRDFDAKYTQNRNPQITFTPPAEVRAGASITLRAEWPADSAETYAYIDVPTSNVVSKREVMRVSWHTTAGSFASDRTGRADDDLATFTENTWNAPSDPGSVSMWVILRDDRGGVNFQKAVVSVR